MKKPKAENNDTNKSINYRINSQERKAKVQRYLEKKRRRRGEKAVRYECRQDLASKRFRFQGRFIKFEDLHKYQGKYIIDYTGRKLVKPIFEITKVKVAKE